METRIGYKYARQKVLQALSLRIYSHEVRHAIDVKNLLHSGDVTPDEVISLIESSSGADYSSSMHHVVQSVEVHVIRCSRWYIKFYFVDPDTVFISVHQ